jgi:hypothetical protein
MPSIRATILRTPSGSYNLMFADSNDSSKNRTYDGLAEPRLITELRSQLSLSAAEVQEITASLQGPFPIIKFRPVDEATYKRVFG